MDVTFETFRGDVEDLEAMAHTAWRDEYGLDSYPNLYSPKYFDYLCGAIEHRDHLIGAYRNNMLTAFLAALPRRFHFKGEIYRAALACLLVTRKEAFRKGIALGLVAKALEINKKYGYDFALLYLETGHRSSKMLRKLKEAGNPVHKVKRMNVIIRAIDLEKIFASENVKWYEKALMRTLKLDKVNPRPRHASIRRFQAEDLDQCGKLLDDHKNNVTLTRILDPDECLRELNYKDVSHSLVWDENGTIRGLINWALIDHVGKFPQRWAWLNHLHFGDLNPQESNELVRAFVLKTKVQQAAGAVEWAKNYYRKGPLWKNRFIPYFRSVDMLAWVFNPELDLSDIPDVYELQI